MIRRVTQSDRNVYMDFTAAFYNSSAVSHDIPEIYRADAFDELMSCSDYAEAFIFEADSKPVGYALIAKTYSQEAGGKVIWIEELYVLPEYRSRGIGREFFEYIGARAKEEGVARIRLEAEPENTAAISLYKRFGFSELGYTRFVLELRGE